MQTSPEASLRRLPYAFRTGSVSLLLLFAAALPLIPLEVQAGATRIFDQSASGTGQSAAFVAQADDPSAIYYNPAGMTQLRGLQTSFGTLLLGGTTTFRHASLGTAESTLDGTIAYPLPMNVYVTANLKDLGFAKLGDLSAGLGILSPFGTLIRWPDTGPFSTAVTFAALELVDVKPTLAYKLNDQLSFGLGADIYTFFNFWGEGQAEVKFLSSGAPGLPPAGSLIEINGRDTAAGFNVSLLYTPFRNEDGKPLTNVGLQYRSQATLHLDGQFLANGALVADSSATLVLPQIITGGVALWPVRDGDHEWKLELDVDYTDWKSHRNLDFHLSNGTTILVPRNWRSTFTIMIGSEYTWLHPAILPEWEVAVRGGYWFSQTPVPDTTFSPDVPDADNHAISTGLGLMCKGSGRFLGLFQCGRAGGSKWRPKAVGLDLAFQVLLYETRTVSGNQQPLTSGTFVDGNYKTTLYVGMINLSAHF